VYYDPKPIFCEPLRNTSANLCENQNTKPRNTITP